MLFVERGAPELGRLSNLESIKLSRNILTRPIPYGLRNVASSDLGPLGLTTCGRIPVPANLGASTVDNSRGP